jgi:hypothetical protein
MKLKAGFAPIPILLVVVVLGAVGFYSYQKIAVPQTPTSPISSNSPLNSSNPSSDQTANWKTHKSPDN